MSDVVQQDKSFMTDDEIIENAIAQAEKENEAQASGQQEATPAPEAQVQENNMPAEQQIASGEETPKEEIKIEYAPDFTFRVLNEQKEFDEKVKAFIKDKETEEFFRDMYTRAYGLDTIKPKYEKTKEELGKLREVEQEYGTYKKSLDALNEMINQGNQGNKDAIYNILDVFGINEQQLALALAEKLQWTPEQRQARDARLQSIQQQSKADQYQSRLAEQEAKLVEMETRMGISSALQHPEIASKAGKINELLGGGEALFNEIWDEGYKLQLQGKASSYEEVVSMVINKYSKFIGNVPVNNTNIQPKTQAPAPNTIPNIRAGATTSEAQIPVFDARKESYDDYVSRIAKLYRS